MKKLSLSLLILTCFVLTSCSDAKKSNIIATDFDEIKSWNWGNESFSNKYARSGSFSIYANEQHPFSLTYETPIEPLKAAGRTKVTASIWIKTISILKDAQWVASVNSPSGANYSYKSTFLNSVTEADENGWRNVKVQMDLPEVAPNGVLKIYGWSPSKEEFFLDDFELTYE